MYTTSFANRYKVWSPSLKVTLEPSYGHLRPSCTIAVSTSNPDVYITPLSTLKAYLALPMVCVRKNVSMKFLE